MKIIAWKPYPRVAACGVQQDSTKGGKRIRGRRQQEDPAARYTSHGLAGFVQSRSTSRRPQIYPRARESLGRVSCAPASFSRRTRAGRRNVSALRRGAVQPAVHPSPFQQRPREAGRCSGCRGPHRFVTKPTRDASIIEKMRRRCSVGRA